MLRTRLLNVASPDPFVVALVVELPVKGPGPVATVMFTVAPESATALPYWSWTCTVTAGLMAVPAVVVVGCWTKLSLLAPAGFTVMPLWVPVMVARRRVGGGDGLAARRLERDREGVGRRRWPR